VTPQVLGHDRPTRVVLNFTHRCALSCEWCYVPFSAPAVKRDTVIRIVERVQALGFRAITLGGGDPLQYRFIEAVLRRAKTLDLFVHVDTHGKGLRETEGTRYLLSECVDLLGLPLDGASAEVHDSMRSAGGHFDMVLQRLRWLKPYMSDVKINTIVSARNVDTLQQLAHLIRKINPMRWSLYQYWPLGPAGAVRSVHDLQDGDFAHATSGATAILAGDSIIVEVNSRQSRRATYPIVHHDGTAFIHSPAPHDSFQEVGSIFDDSVHQVILQSCVAERPDAVTRYKGKAGS
jgi:MoaA/NifB/PqqE/SkfB family radical SAM enzyme